jgi:hypothetical protein
MTLYNRISALGMSFADAIAQPFEGVAANGGGGQRLKRST